VTLPGLRPILVFVITVTILASANVFGQAYLITEGAPGDETQTAIMYLAEEGLRNFNMGSAAAMSYVLALFLAVISVVNFVLIRYRED
jgi:multiple sugar transport system permease protein